MAANFTREHKLVEDISSKSWFANPAGRQGYQVILLELVGDGGTRFYHSLGPGETLRVSERLFGKYTALAVDTRHARSFPIQGQFYTRNRGRKVILQANVRYRVIDARVVAMETLDPLGELRDMVTATLNRDLANYSEVDITPFVIEQVISKVGQAPHLGLTVEGAEILEFTPDTRMTQQTVEQEDLRHDVIIGGIRSQAEFDEADRQQAAKIRWKQETHSAIDLSDINVFLHEHPELADKIFSTFAGRDQLLLQTRMEAMGPAIQDYIDRQRDIEGEVDPDVIIKMLDTASTPASTRLQSPVQHQIVWGDEEVVDAQPAEQPYTTFTEEDEAPEEGGKKPPDDSSRIKFAD